MRAAVFLAICLASSPPVNDRAWHRLVGILQYLQSDYPQAVRTRDPLELEEQKSLAQEALQALDGLDRSGAAYRPELEAIVRQIHASAPPEEVERNLEALVDRLVASGGLVRSPRTTPDLARAETVFQASCASCHGPEGRADGPAANALVPPPTSFHGEKLARLTPYQLFNTITFGVKGTGMAAFPNLSEDDRWALAFFVTTLRQPPCKGPGGTASLEALASRTDAQLAESHGADAVPCLRRVRTAQTHEGLGLAREHVERARALARAGDLEGARQAVVDAYLEGIEPVEPRLRAKSPEAVPRLEAAFLRARTAAERGPADFESSARALVQALDAAMQERAPAATFTTVFWLALLVLLREGFEASIVVAALLAVLKKLGQERRARVVHVGWSSALVAGALSFALGQRLLAGANREWMEGIVALLACGMLLYAAVWLNARAQISKHMGEIRSRVQGSLDGGRTVGLFFIAFSAVFRECFETALFLQGLSIDSPAGAAWGGAAGLAALLALVLLIRRVGYRLPMKPLFKVSTWLLLATAVVLAGKGLRALQEVAAVPLRPIPFVAVEALGIFPDAYTLGAQVALVVLIVVFGLWQGREKTPRPAADIRSSELGS